MRKINKSALIAGLMIAFALMFELAAHADESDQSTTLTFNQPIQIPGQVLPAGTYLFILAANDSDRNIVQIFNSDKTALYATIQTIPTERQDVTGDTALAFAERGDGKPEVLLKWFYPGETTGNEFVYPKQEEKALAQDTQQTVVANQPAVPNSDNPGAGN
ncbi:MAG: hypothetical protein QOF56_2785 [Acidobacteriaceae bacterium]|jgi:hypothetical protein|nr:hypothetical protein [Acidobacteriaceae bacterium]